MSKTLHSYFIECARHYGPRTALMYKADGAYREITFRQFEEQVRNFALALWDLGVRRGDRVAILSENRPEWAVSDLAILSEGAITIPVYQTNSPKEVGYILNDAEAKVVIVSTKEQLEKIDSIRSDLPSLERIIMMDPVDEKDVDFFDALLKSGRERSGAEPGLFGEHLRRTVSSDVATIIYTSGTTGEPKGVMLTHENILFNVQASESVVPVTEEDRCLSFLPLSHVFERTVGQFFMIFHGIAIAYAESIDTVAENMMEVRPTIVVSVPRLYEKMYARVMEKVNAAPSPRRKIFSWGIETGRKLTPYRLQGKKGPLGLRLQYGLADRLVFHKIRERIGGKLRYFICGGAPLSREIAEFFYAAGVTILEGYGLTETSPVITANRHDMIRFGTIGPALPGVEVAIMDDGEILTRSPSVMKGYFKNETATKEVIDPDGWFHTGDVGQIDEDGFVRITDRKKDMIVTSGGKNVAPQYLENLLTSDKYISQVMVYGDKRKYLTALVIPDFGALSEVLKGEGLTFADDAELSVAPRARSFLFSRIREKLRDLARFEQIKKIALLDHELTREAGELTPTLKIRRKEVTRKYFDLLDALYEKEF
ncbi:MAG: long-chain fatty acid--CoA ligase [Deltaproteobacteria bacterium]|nr:long-chain fatty acid--CoA ligase [Deltaproteobacteria bacterium]